MQHTKSPALFPWLDLLRFVAAFVVMFSHARTLVWVRYSELDPDSQGLVTASFFGLTRLGNEAVVLFFVLSGFLVGGKVWQRARQGTFDARLYVIDRTTRIMLPLVVILVITLFIRQWIEHEWFWAEFFSNILSLQGITVPALGLELPELGYNHPLWSLPYEVWCYVMALGVGMALSGRWYLGTALVLSSVFYFLFCIVPWYTLVWLLGAAVYQWRNRLRSNGLLCLGVIFSLYGWINLQFADGLLPESWFANSGFVLGYYRSTLLLGLGFSLLVHQISQMHPKSIISKKLNKMGHVMAASSYSLYLSHFVVLQVLDWKVMDTTDVISLDSVFALIWVVVLCQLVAFAIYMLSEMHTDAVRQFLKRVFPAKV